MGHLLSARRPTTTRSSPASSAKNCCARMSSMPKLTISAGVMLRRMQNRGSQLHRHPRSRAAVPFSRLRTAWIFDAARQFGAEAAMEVARWAAKLQKSRRRRLRHGRRRTRLPHRQFPPRLRFRAQRRPAHRLPRGRNRRPVSVREAIELLGAERIGHGIAVMHDPALADSLATRRIVLENCPTSNLCTGALARQTEKPDASLKDHPLPAFIRRGLFVTLSTDDPAMFHTDLLTEYSKAASLGLTNQATRATRRAKFSRRVSSARRQAQVAR